MVGGRASQKGTLLTNVPDVSGAEDAFKKILRLKIKQNSKLEITASLTTSILRRRNGTEKREAGARAGQAGSQLRPHVMWVSSCRPLTALQIDRAIGLNHTHRAASGPCSLHQEFMFIIDFRANSPVYIAPVH